MVKRATWETKYGLQFVSGIGSVPTFATGASNVGIGADTFGLLLTNQPDFAPNKSIIDTRKTTGLATRRGGTGYEFQSERVMPSVSLDMSVGRKALSAFAWLLFQSGVSQGAGPLYKKTCVPYATGVSSAVAPALPEAYACLIKDFGGGADLDEHQLMSGAICKSLALDGSEGGELKMTAEMAGAAFAQSFTEGGNYSLNFEAEAPLLFKDLTFTLQTVTVNISAFNFTLTNNASPRSYNSGQIQAFILKDFLASGSFTIPIGESGAKDLITQYLNQTTVALAFIWGTPSSNLVKFSFNARISSAPVNPGEEVEINCNFEAVNTGASSITLEIEDSLNRGIS